MTDKKLLIAGLSVVALMLLIAFCVPAIAQSPDAGVAVDGGVAVADGGAVTDGGKPEYKPPTIPTDPTWEELINMFFLVISDFRTFGLLAGFVTLISLLVMLLRQKALNAWIEKKGWKKYKVYVAAGLGAVLMFLSGLASGLSVGAAILAGLSGLVTGLSATGLHNVATKGNQPKPKPENP